MDLSTRLDENISKMKNAFLDCDDIIMRNFNTGAEGETGVFLIYTDNIVSTDIIEQSVMTNLMNRINSPGKGEHSGTKLMEALKNSSIAVGEVSEVKTFEEVFDAVLIGDLAFFVKDCASALIISAKAWPTRGVPEAETEINVFGPKDAFCESASLNTVLIRRRIKDTRLKVKRKTVGKRSKTGVVLMYMEDIVRPKVLEKINSLIDNVETDGIFDSGMLEQLWEKNSYSPFPQMQMTERPDKAAAAIMEGRVVLVVDNTPFSLVLPTTFNVFFQAAEDYYERFEIASIVRVLRFLGFFMATFLPGLYIALTVFHPSALPAPLLLKIAGSRQKVPFPTVAEIMIMEIAFELLREAGIRLPSPVSSTIGIVGGIIIGQAVVDAGFVSSVVVISASITAISSFVIPNNAFVSGVRVCKYFVILLSSIFGIYGFMLAFLAILTHLCSLTSFEIPYMFPYCSASVNDYQDLKDSIFRLPLFMLKRRPIFARADARNKTEGKEGA